MNFDGVRVNVLRPISNVQYPTPNIRHPMFGGKRLSLSFQLVAWTGNTGNNFDITVKIL